MLPTELLLFRVKAGLVELRCLKTTNTLKLAESLIHTFKAHLGQRRSNLDNDLKTLEAGRSDFKVLRGLAHLLTNGASTFETGGDVDPGLVWGKVFELAQAQPPSRHRRRLVLEQAAKALSQETPLQAEDIAELLYADLPDQQRLVAFDPPEPADLIERFTSPRPRGCSTGPTAW